MENYKTKIRKIHSYKTVKSLETFQLGIRMPVMMCQFVKLMVLNMTTARKAQQELERTPKYKKIDEKQIVYIPSAP